VSKGGFNERYFYAASSSTSNFLFCGFEKNCPLTPGTKVGMIHAWNLLTPQAPPLEFHAGDPTSVPFAHGSCITALLPIPDATGVAIVSASEDCLIKVWRFDAGRFSVAHTLIGHVGSVTGITQPAGAPTVLWSSSKDTTIRIWDLVSGKCGGVLLKDGHTGEVTSVLAWASDMGSFVFSSSMDGSVIAWGSADGKKLATETHGMGVLCIATTKDEGGNPLLVCGLEHGKIMVRALPGPSGMAPLTLVFTIDKFRGGHMGAVHAVEAGEGPVGIFYSAGKDGKIKVWQIQGNLAQMAQAQN